MLAIIDVIKLDRRRLIHAYPVSCPKTRCQRALIGFRC